jgi:hypothetical protein
MVGSRKLSLASRTGTGEGKFGGQAVRTSLTPSPLTFTTPSRRDILPYRLLIVRRVYSACQVFLAGIFIVWELIDALDVLVK